MEIVQELLPSPIVSKRFRSFLPVVIDMETGGYNDEQDAILEISATVVNADSHGKLSPGHTFFAAVHPHPTTKVHEEAINFHGINPNDPNRNACDESEALKDLFQLVRRAIRAGNCTRAILTGHNAHFDLGFLMQACRRNNIKKIPFHPFSCFDTVSLAGAQLGHTVLETACLLAGLEFDKHKAHGAAYDCQKTTELFCLLCNQFDTFGD